MRNKHGSMSLFLCFSIGRKVNARGSAFARTLPFPPCLALYLLACKTHMKKSLNAEFFPRYVWHESIRLSNRVLLLNCGTIFSFLSCKAFVLFYCPAMSDDLPDMPLNKGVIVKHYVFCCISKRFEFLFQICKF